MYSVNSSRNAPVVHVTEEISLLPFFEELLKKSGVEHYDADVIHYLMIYIKQLLKSLTNNFVLNVLSTETIFFNWIHLNSEMLEFFDDRGAPSHDTSILSWFFKNGMPQHSFEALFRVNMNHKRKRRYPCYDLQAEAAALLFNQLTEAPVEHRIKLLHSLEQLRKQQEIESKSTWAEQPEESITNEENYLKNLGEFKEMKLQEDYLRRLFLQNKPDEFSTNTGMDLLIDVYQNFGTFIHSSFYLENAAELCSARIHRNYRVSVVDITTFTNTWLVFTNHMFDNVDWNNIFVAGGSVLACLRDSDHVLNSSWASHNSDIDVFVYGLSPEQATKKIQQVIATICSNTKREGHLLVSNHSVTLLGLAPYRNVQFVLRCYRNISEVLVGFDIDCCCVGCNGKTVYAIPRSRRALNYSCNFIDISRRSYTYESRLIKYVMRGFSIVVPGLRRSNIDSNRLYGKRISQCAGLTKLLVYDSIFTYNDQIKLANRAKINRHYRLNQTGVTLEKLRDLKRGRFNKSDYGWVPVFGNITQEAVDLLKEKKQHNMKDGSIIYYYSQEEFLGIHLKWMTENPGKQMFTGSFHPIEDKSWEDRSSWDRSVPPSVPVTLKDIFDHQRILKMATVSKNAMNVLSRFRPFIGNDLLSYIFSLLRTVDLAKLCCVCKPFPEYYVTLTKPEISSITVDPSIKYSLVVEHPESLSALGEVKDLFSDSLRGITLDIRPRCTLSASANNFLHSLLFNLIEKLFRLAIATRFLNGDHSAFNRELSPGCFVAGLKLFLPPSLAALLEQAKSFVLDGTIYMFGTNARSSSATHLPTYNLRLLLDNFVGHSTQQCRISKHAMTFIAYVLEYFIKQAMSNVSCENGIIESHHIMDSISQNSELKDFLGYIVPVIDRPTVIQEGQSPWKQFFPSIELDQGADSLFHEITHNFVKYFVDNIIPFLIADKTNSVQAVHVVRAMTTLRYKGHLIPYGFVKIDGEQQVCITFSQAELNKFIEKITDSMNSLYIQTNNDACYVEPTVRLPKGIFHEKVLEELNKHFKDSEISDKAESILQYTVEYIMEQLAQDFCKTAQYTGSIVITEKDIKLTLFIQNKMFLINRIKYFDSVTPTQPICPSPPPCLYPVTYNSKYPKHEPRSFLAAREALGSFKRCSAKFGVQLVDQVHSVLKVEKLEFPTRIFVQMVRKAMSNDDCHLPRSSALMMQEIVESAVVTLLKNGLKCMKHLERKELTVADLHFVTSLRK